MNPSSLLNSQKSSFEPISYKIDQSRLVLGPNEKIDESLLCGICQEVPFHPEECVTCQNMFCSECITAWIEKKAKCPYSCPPPYQSSRPHKLIRQALSALKYTCKNKENGCEEVLAMESIEKHEGKCGFGKIKCPISEECKEEMMRKELEEHEKICEYFMIKCEKCEFSVARKLFANHDCISFLRDKYLSLDKSFAEYKELNEKTIADIIKKLQQLEISIQNKEKFPLNQIKPNNNERVCQKGHLLSWSNGEDIKECDLCKRKQFFSRFSCGFCNVKYCVYCVYPFLGEKRCPLGHVMVAHSKLAYHSCDLCRKTLDKEPEVYRDQQCDFDCCQACFQKASK